MTWREIYREFSKEPFGWGPDVVNNLTMYQVRMYLGADEDMKAITEPKIPKAEKPDYGWSQWTDYLNKHGRQIDNEGIIFIDEDDE